MKAVSTWSSAPYRPPFVCCGDIYICRIVPFETSIHFEWLETEGAEGYQIFCRKRGQDVFILTGQTDKNSFEITGLEAETDYEFYVTSGLLKSRVRLARTGICFFGSVVNYLHPDDEAYSFSGKYLCSPSFVRLPDGVIVASMDVFSGGYPQNLSLIFRSEDNGKSWHYACELFPCFWGKLFLYRDELYMLACSTEYGDLLIGKSVDGGKSFCEPTVLLRGGNGKNGEAGVHKNPQPVVEYNGRIWNTLEWGSWGRGYHAPMVASAEIGSDIMKKESWLFSEPVMYDHAWEGAPKGKTAGPLEGCLVAAPEGKLYNIMRYQMQNMTPNYGLALIYEVDAENPEAPLKFSRAMEFPANHSKFEIKYDEKSKRYYTLASRILDKEKVGSRNLLSLMSSKDLCKWEVELDVIDRRDRDPMQEGFQYVDFEFEGDDIVFLCRTAINGAHNYHDANYSVFDRIENFREL
ncbi:MAG: hypothetical protein IJZ34_16495 [Lachnospiraceae bacterium]|nr:hypothetical protein [Lachnospiraceae bacterium]